MPWCDDCSHFWNPNSMQPDGGCPTCGRVLTKPAAAEGVAVDGGDDEAGVEAVTTEETKKSSRAPWHFKLLVVALVIYLGWRAWQGLVWLFG